MSIIWCMVPQIWCVTDRIFCHFGSFFSLLLPNNPKNQNFEKLKKKSEYIIISHKCTRNHNHMLYCSLDMARNGCNCYILFWASFYPFTFLTAQKSKFRKNGESVWRYHHFTINQKSWSYTILFLRYGAWRNYCNYFSFWATFYPFTPLTTRKIKIKKTMKKKFEDIINLL